MIKSRYIYTYPLCKENCEDLYEPQILTYLPRKNMKISLMDPLRILGGPTILYEFTVMFEGKTQILSVGPAAYKQIVDLYKNRKTPARSNWRKFCDWVYSFFFSKKNEDYFEFNVVTENRNGHNILRFEATNAS